MCALSGFGLLSLNNPELVRSDFSIFTQPWWLDTVRRSPDYREVRVLRGSRVVGRLAFVVRKNSVGLTQSHNPYWSHLGGPIVDAELDRVEQAEVIRQLIEQLPRRTSYHFVCDANLSYADLVRCAFRAAGFEHSTEVTYVRLPNEGDILNSRKSKHRKHLKRAAKSLTCVDIGAGEFVRLMETNLKMAGKRTYAPLDILQPLIEEAITRGRARAIAARPNLQDNLCSDSKSVDYDAAIVYLWDDHRCFYWLSTHRVAAEGDQKPRPQPDAVKLLAVQAMEHAQAMNLIFDADGVVSPGADHLYRNILGVENQDRRDVFKRSNVLERLYQKYRKELSSKTAWF